MNNILVVDDDANIRAILKYRFEKEDFTVWLATNGCDALEKLNTQRPDLIILDIMMPEIDGLEFLSTLRDDPTTSSIPVIVLSALGRGSHSAVADALGIHSFVSKPFSPKLLVQEARKALNGDHVSDSRNMIA